MSEILKRYLKMCNKAVHTFPECCEDQEMINKIIFIFLILFTYACDWHKSQTMCVEIVSEYPLMLKYYPDI